MEGHPISFTVKDMKINYFLIQAKHSDKDILIIHLISRIGGV